MKKCLTCKKEKEYSEFNKHWKRKDKLQSNCRDCNKTRSRKYYKENPELHRKNVKRINAERLRVSREYVLNYLNCNPCVECGENDPIVLEFDHLRNKKIEISKAMRNHYTLNKIKEEIAKCQVLCANCHRRKTAKEFGWYRSK